jgi:hypothetical protein
VDEGRSFAEIHVCEVEAHALREPDAGAVERLEECAVPLTDRVCGEWSRATVLPARAARSRARAPADTLPRREERWSRPQPLTGGSLLGPPAYDIAWRVTISANAIWIES